MKKALLYSALFVSLCYSCSNNPKPAQQDAVAKDTMVSDEHASHHPENGVKLNNGEKWPANAETTEGINKMKALVAAFPPQPGLEDYHTLQSQLEAEFNQVIEKCTMQGEAHEQLHAYLIPLTEMFKQLDSADLEVCRKTLDELKRHLAEYNNYFL